MATHFSVYPRYTAGSPGMVNESLALRVAEQEKVAHEHAKTGFYGETDQKKAEELRLRGIAEKVRERPKGWEVEDLITGEKFFRPFFATCPKCLAKRVPCKKGKLEEHYRPRSIYKCDGTDIDMTKKVEF